MASKAPGVMTRDMSMVHTGFLREFFLMPELVRTVFEGDRRRAEIVHDHVGLISMGLHHHHHAEDLEIWPRLLERAPEEIRPLVHGMEEHHELIGTLTTRLIQELATWRADPTLQSRTVVEGTLGELLPVVREHLNDELKYVLPLIEKHIQAEEWDAMAAANFGALPPDLLPVAVGLFMYEAEPAQVRELLDNIGEEVRVVISEMAPKAYGDYAERVYGTRTPPLWSSIATR
ncbi:hypothetical protein HH310_19590 [Actinoplanes sp. TBRC 11911]|uniref:hemerythrin domain-containing protein n=1 Tax=Actinoplanes sp. TBRC 11911 TaxID=2729386 RepID=UPI00145DF5FF|nr:hemerythrin domain-containing protein [Actinoplanes sp. TBRC 11911]NMO53383.1 hypothetical protein [Actinoplanes sp. TBRC 11911]